MRQFLDCFSEKVRSLSTGKCQCHREQCGVIMELQVAWHRKRVVEDVGEGQEVKLFKNFRGQVSQGFGQCDIDHGLTLKNSELFTSVIRFIV